MTTVAKLRRRIRRVAKGPVKIAGELRAVTFTVLFAMRPIQRRSLATGVITSSMSEIEMTRLLRAAVARKKGQTC